MQWGEALYKGIAFHYVWFTFTFHLNCYITKFPTYPRSNRNFSSLFISWHELFTKSRNIRLRVRHENSNSSPFPILVQPSSWCTPVSIIYPLCTAMKRWPAWLLSRLVSIYLPFTDKKCKNMQAKGPWVAALWLLTWRDVWARPAMTVIFKALHTTFILQ